MHLFEERGLLDASMLRASTLVTLGLILHDFPEGIAMAVPAVATRRRTMLFAVAFVSVLAEPAGALVGLALVQLQPPLNGMFIAGAAGAMIFVSVHELLPMAVRFGNLPLFGAGLALSVPVYVLLRSIVPG